MLEHRQGLSDFAGAALSLMRKLHQAVYARESGNRCFREVPTAVLAMGAKPSTGRGAKCPFLGSPARSAYRRLWSKADDDTMGTKRQKLATSSLTSAAEDHG
jgi:hypothetical protein